MGRKSSDMSYDFLWKCKGDEAALTIFFDSTRRDLSKKVSKEKVLEELSTKADKQIKFTPL
jgi:hypothetical protein